MKIPIHPVKIIRRPVMPHGHVIQDEALIELLEFGDVRLKPPSKAVSSITIEIAQHADGLWMWSTSGVIRKEYRGYRVGPKWGLFAETRQDAITAACNELAERSPTPGVLAWIEQLCAPKQQELFT